MFNKKILLSICLLFFSFSAFAESEIPTQANYARYIAPLEVVLPFYKKIAENGGWGGFTIGKTIKPGESDQRIPEIRKILSITGDYKGGESNSEILDSYLEEAVRSFQTLHGLEADGTIGKKTQIELNIPVEGRIAQIERTIEKMRGMPDLGERYILVNVAGFYLQAVEKNKTALSSRIIVGDLKNHTPLFQGEITEISFNPQWNVPARIAREELVVKQRENPDYLEHGNYMVKDHDGDIIDPADVDWNSHEAYSYRIIQRSGDGNALGKVKFNVPNIYGVYLHSTSTPKLFAKTTRAFSHGCMRVEEARNLTYFLMGGGENGFDKEKIDKLYDSDNTKTVRIQPVPVYVTYFTSWVDEESGKVHFQPDVYGIEKVENKVGK